MKRKENGKWKTEDRMYGEYHETEVRGQKTEDRRDVRYHEVKKGQTMEQITIKMVCDSISPLGTEPLRSHDLCT